MGHPTIVVHAGAGSPGSPPEEEPALRAGLEEALLAAHAVLEREAGAAIDAAQEAVMSLEACPLFNAGRGSALNEHGRVEMDAALMCGRTGRAGAVAAVSSVRHPIALARAVMERSPHVLLAGRGAERFAKGCGLEVVASGYHLTERQLQRWRRGAGPGVTTPSLGTVGAVALDRRGDLASATSTGGPRGKLQGRVGDSPLIGAGTYADNRTCAVSATGDGECLMTAVAAYDASRLMAYRALPVEEACEVVVRERLAPLGGEAGLIALDPRGNIAMPFSARVFHRGVKAGDSPVQTALTRWGA